MFVSQKHLLVEWGHCDPAGIVFFPQYLVWFDDCMTALFANAGLPLPELFKRYAVIGVPIVDLRARFIAPSTFGDRLSAESQVTEFGKSSFVIRHQIFKADVLVVEGFARRVWTGADPTDPSKMKSRPLPAEVVERLSATNAGINRKT